MLDAAPYAGQGSRADGSSCCADARLGRAAPEDRSADSGDATTGGEFEHDRVDDVRVVVRARALVGRAEWKDAARRCAHRRVRVCGAAQCRRGEPEQSHGELQQPADSRGAVRPVGSDQALGADEALAGNRQPGHRGVHGWPELARGLDLQSGAERGSPGLHLPRGQQDAHECCR